MSLYLYALASSRDLVKQPHSSARACRQSLGNIGLCVDHERPSEIFLLPVPLAQTESHREAIAIEEASSEKGILGSAGADVTHERRKRVARAPLPYVTVTEILDLLAILGDEQWDFFELAEELGREFGGVLNVVKAAELLDLVTTPGQKVIISDFGKKVDCAQSAERTGMMRVQIEKLKVFDLLLRLIIAQPNQELKEEILLQEIQSLFPYEKPHQLIETILDWGLYAQIISYDPTGHLLTPGEYYVKLVPTQADAPPLYAIIGPSPLPSFRGQTNEVLVRHLLAYQIALEKVVSLVPYFCQSNLELFLRQKKGYRMLLMGHGMKSPSGLTCGEALLKSILLSPGILRK